MERLIMYCTPYCPDCRHAREWLEQRGQDYEEIDVSVDMDARALCEGYNHGRLHTPTFEYGDRILVDFDPRALSEFLES